MDPITLYSSDENRKAAFARATVWIGAGILSIAFLPFGKVLAIPLIAIGAWFGGPELGWRGSKRTSFKADADGFTVGQAFTITDRHRLKWDEFRGVELHTEGFGALLSQSVLVVKTASKGNTKIRQSMMSGTPEDMAEQIEEYARRALLVEEARAGFATLNDGGPRAGPVRSTLRLSERLFGRRKVI